MAEIDEIVPALQLLLSDLSPDDKIRAINRALAADVFATPKGFDLLGRLNAVHHSITSASEIVDGSSGLGAVAAKNAAKEASAARAIISSTIRSLF